MFYLYDRVNKKEATTSEVFDAFAGFALDGLAGYTTGKALSNRSKTTMARLPEMVSSDQGSSANLKVKRHENKHTHKG